MKENKPFLSKTPAHFPPIFRLSGAGHLPGFTACLLLFELGFSVHLSGSKEV